MWGRGWGLRVGGAQTESSGDGGWGWQREMNALRVVELSTPAEAANVLLCVRHQSPLSGLLLGPGVLAMSR